MGESKLIRFECLKKGSVFSLFLPNCQISCVFLISFSFCYVYRCSFVKKYHQTDNNRYHVGRQKSESKKNGNVTLRRITYQTRNLKLNVTYLKLFNLSWLLSSLRPWHFAKMFCCSKKQFLTLQMQIQIFFSPTTQWVNVWLQSKYLEKLRIGWTWLSWMK